MPEVAINSLTRVSFVDTAGSKQTAKYGTSRSAIITIGQDSLEYIFILDVFIERCATTVLEQKILYTQNQWKPTRFGIDVSGPQGLFYDTMRRRAREEGIRIHWEPVTAYSDKLFGIERGLEPIIRAGRLIRPAEKYCLGLREEFRRFPDPMFNDGMDALANAIRLLPSSLPEHLRQMSKERLRAYLERTGAPRELIEERMAQHDAYNQ
jgi:hypothetical protein